MEMFVAIFVLALKNSFPILKTKLCSVYITSTFRKNLGTSEVQLHFYLKEQLNYNLEKM